MVQSESDSKVNLIKQICDISNHANSCVHHDTFDSGPFIDWYILLQLEDNVNLDTIRKRYHKYALLLHPDKNKHPKAEFAFKLVSEAYACLSDEAKRLDFDVKRWKNLCRECIKTPQSRTKVKGPSSPSDRSRSKKISTRMKEVKARFMEEARVIEKCLKVNANVDLFDKEIPVFNPNNYVNQGYPHFRVGRRNELKNSKLLKKGFKFDNQEQRAKVKCDSPIFQCKPNRSSVKLQS
ncbi:putative DnaJ domain, Chaperone J-domain superfamily [Helianthus annuus]|uniref:DnaJ domain, Chaperone J-domain superfamily n=1 Tax=Helianthus annuus TaxID=4232 RepID=A0A251UIA6_HELAN|nr:dnaJ-related protein rsp1 [Helianthus annuus]KAF5801726.1 putative DnaJ domain, Chaperone J-domain superfamily [Helianthus annuus]KAJ0566154.1 putative DnaJ domain, Chaperone J-domain superfamily [Helianthus annuus]